MTRDNREDVSHFTPFVMEEEIQRPAQPEPQRERRSHMPQAFTFITHTFGPGGMVITRRVTTHDGNSQEFARNQPQDFFDSLFGNPFGGLHAPRMFSMADIIELSMRDAGRMGIPPAPEEAISKLEEVDINKEHQEQCPVCMEDIVKKGLKLPCGHIFDRNCVTTWLKQHNSCPVCRKGIDEEGPSKD